MAKRKQVEENKVDTGRWLLTYSDMMNNLLVLFMMLYSISIVNMQKLQAITKEFQSTFHGSEAVQTTGTSSVPSEELAQAVIDEGNSAEQQAEQKFDELYEKVKENLAKKGLTNSVDVEKGEGYIYFRFKESALFYPDSPAMKPGGSDILQYVGSTVKTVDSLVASIQIGGHTAQVGPDSTTNFFSWELSSDRAITVLKFLVQKCALPQSKMTVAGYSHYFPVASNANEEGRSANRRVEIKVSRVQETSATTPPG